MTFLLRAFSLGFLAWHLGLLFPGLAEPVFLTSAAVAGIAGGALVRPWRGWLALAAGLGSAVAAWGLLTGIPGWLAGTGGPSPLDPFPLWAGRQLTFSILPFAVGWVEGWAFTGRPTRRALERIVNALVLAAVFWSQGPYHVTLYSHPLVLALVLGTFLASEVVLLADRRPRFTPWAPALLVILAGIGLLWGLLNRYEDQSTASGGGLMKPDLFQFDFAPLVRLEDEITLGDNLVLLYREDGPPKRRYLRRLVLDAYDPTRGFSMAAVREPAVGRRVEHLPQAAGTAGRTPVRQEYYLVNIDPSSLLALNDPVTVTPFAQWDHSSFVNAYRVDSSVAGDEFWLYNDQSDDGLSPDLRNLDIQGGTDPEIGALARKIAGNAVTPFEKASVVQEYLRDNYYYSLKPGAPGPRGALKHFLFEGKKGYCSYFAFSMTLLLRSLGVPARIAVGFATDPSETVLGFNPVRAFQAHAWVEVPLGPYGWVEFDPTSSTPAPGENFQIPKAQDPEVLSKLISEVLGAKPHPLADGPTGTLAENPALSWARFWAAGRNLWPWALGFLLLAANEGWRHRWRWARFRAPGPRERAALWWAETVFRARRADSGPLPGETPGSWAARNPEVTPLASEAARARYARTWNSGGEARVRPLARALGRRFDRSRPWYRRVASIVFPWWPR